MGEARSHGVKLSHKGEFASHTVMKSHWLGDFITHQEWRCTETQYGVSNYHVKHFCQTGCNWSGYNKIVWSQVINEKCRMQVMLGLHPVPAPRSCAPLLRPCTVNNHSSHLILLSPIAFQPVHCS